jgi:hypothetical protein
LAIPESLKGGVADPATARPCPDGIPSWFATVQKLTASHGADAEAIAASFGKKSAKRSQQMAEILETLRGLGTLDIKD